MPSELFLFAVASIAVPIAVATIFLYLRASFELLELVRRYEPATWRSLGEPERVWVRGGTQGGFDTIQPIGPWLSWVWSGGVERLDPQVARSLARTRRLLRTGCIAFAGAVVAILVLVLTASPAA